MLLCTEAMQKKVDRAVFPALQGGPHNHTTAAMAVALAEAALPSFRDYAHAIVANARSLAAGLIDEGFGVVSGGTDNHLVLFDATPRGVTGKPLARAMNRAGLVANYNNIPFDPRPPMDPSGIRLGTAAVTSRGFGTDEMVRIARWIGEVASNLEDGGLLDGIASSVRELCGAYPAPGIRID
jgi:glycine hydroxymethyltransferase